MSRTTGKHSVGERVELARYRISSGERIVYGQRIQGIVRFLPGESVVVDNRSACGEDCNGFTGVDLISLRVDRLRYACARGDLHLDRVTFAAFQVYGSVATSLISPVAILSPAAAALAAAAAPGGSPSGAKPPVVDLTALRALEVAAGAVSPVPVAELVRCFSRTAPR